MKADVTVQLITGSEIADVLRKALRGEVAVNVDGPAWDDVYCGNVTFAFGAYRIVIYNDCLELDYVDSAVAPDGRVGDFDQWFEHGEEPVSLLTDIEQGELELILECAKAKGE